MQILNRKQLPDDNQIKMEFFETKNRYEIIKRIWQTKWSQKARFINSNISA